jgi:hypothetical protein
LEQLIKPYQVIIKPWGKSQGINYTLKPELKLRTKCLLPLLAATFVKPRFRED